MSHSLIRPLIAPLTRFVIFSLLSFVAALLSGCVILPIPVNFTDDPLSSAQIKSVKPGETTNETVQGTLGSPEFERNGGRMWIYAWESKHGHWVMIPLAPGMPPGASDRIWLTTHVMVLEFDSDGMLRKKEFAQHVKGSEDRYCTEAGVCVEHKDPIGDDCCVKHFRNHVSAVTVTGEARERIGKPLEPTAVECVLVTWPDEDWTQSGETTRGLRLNIEGAAESVIWLPAGAFAAIPLPAGSHPVHVAYIRDAKQSEIIQSHPTFDCEPGAYTYLAIGLEKKDLDKHAIVLRPTEATVARAQVANRPQVLLP